MFMHLTRDTRDQTQILQQLESFKTVPDFNNYLAFIIAHGDQLPVEVSMQGSAKFCIVLPADDEDHATMRLKPF